MPTLEDAIILAANAHKGQRDRNDEPYVMHPVRVMAQLWKEDERMVAILHDVVEDTHVTLDDLRKAGYPDRIVAAVDAISRRKDAGESFSQYIRRVKTNPLATKVKIADLRDNSNLDRLPKVEAFDLRRLDRYNRALQYLINRYESPEILID
ncbi:MAG: bifunctional (p)ppGpp synthetase II/ guanosine-3',5'-bis pyrophosphate 3'-pyrophosphohydrolase [Methanocella sp. PtaU1.Bin125]|nr:MAG: bifunctional (p)ppGpp synthetase II/ guanosine-3',5'-bis pyrophosphate 3'-pyrophosphohydrolase [Methanocella sp. PtaU1.Bin125]